MNYYYMEVYYTIFNKEDELHLPKATGHCIYAKDEQDALNIAKEKGVSCPRYSKNITKREFFKVDENSNFVQRRKKGIGGIIWKR